MNNTTKFLILRFSSIGDIILTTPVVRCLKLQYPHAEIHFLTKDKYGFLIKNNPYIDQKWLLKKDNWGETISALRQEQFDYVIDLHKNIRTLRIKWALGVKSYSFEKLNFQKFLLTNFKINRLPPLHIVDRNMHTVEHFHIKNDDIGLDFFIPPQDEVNKVELPEAFHKEYVVFAIGGQHATKKLPLERLIALCKKINAPVILLGGKEDETTGELLKNTLPKESIYNACGKYNFNQSASILKQAKIVFSHDTGLMHVAAAYKKKVYSIWGNTVPDFGMYPYQTSFEIIENKQLACRPCSKIGHKKCPKKHFKCMNESSFDFKIPELPESL